MSEPEVFGTDADSAARALRSAQIAEARVRRHSVNSGLVPLGWGLIVLVGLSLYEFFSRPSLHQQAWACWPPVVE